MTPNPNDTRKLLKLFGVAVTTFEEESAALLERLREMEPGDDELVAAVRELIELIGDTNEKWQEATDHLFESQRRVLADVVQALPRAGE